MIQKKHGPIPGSLPSYVIYDNSCTLYRHCEASGSTLHHQVGLPVDVFHWKCKHKQTNDACAIHCNPYNYAELRTEDNRGWFFNSSIAEQTNVWFGGYHSIVREMGEVMYNFFLDEMIMEKNRLTKERLRAKRCLMGYRNYSEVVM